ncbi:MAG TPA: carboxypeptidase regulatory-like domain-containing protein, partial [Candidatus Eremiobacteraceae bacterium]|nr:carboxypeptidase regulatory-like domain-containing protein [Candidatus Eremiobacteraceae bacterium]
MSEESKIFHSKKEIGRKKSTAIHAMFGTLIRAGLCAVWVLFFLAKANGQLYTGSVTGVVTDPSGSAIPNAKVTLVDQDRGFVFNYATDNTGRYLLRSIPPGTYKLTAEAANFQSQVKDNIKIDVTQNVSVDFSLKVGSSNETVEVNASSVQLQTEDAVTGQVVNRKFVNDLPLNDRNFMDLTFLAPGVVETNVPGSRNGVNFNSNGGRNSTADVLIDGASATNFEQNSGLQSLPYEPSVDSVEEFK